MTEELAYKRKARLRGKHRKVRAALVNEMNNLVVAERNARMGKKPNHKGVRLYDRDPQGKLNTLQSMLNDGTYHTSEGRECMRRCPCGKTRKLHKLPYFPDHIEQHAVMNVIMPSLVKSIYYENGASVVGKGTMFAKRRTRRWIDKHAYADRIYYAKLDFVKFYENVSQKHIYDTLCGFYGDKNLRRLLWEIIGCCEHGLGIGLYPVQMLTNYYLSIPCRECSRMFDVKVIAYCDDVVIMGLDKHEVWKAVRWWHDYASNVMEQPLHDGVCVQIIDNRHALDFVGFQFFKDHTLLRKRMKIRFKKRMRRNLTPLKHRQMMASYKGWLMHCDGFALWKKITNMNSFDDFDIPDMSSTDGDGKRIFDGTRVSATILQEREIVFKDVEFDVKSKCHKSGKTNIVLVEDNGQRYKFFTNNDALVKQLQWCDEHDKFPFLGKLRRMNTGGNADYRIVGVNS